MCVSYPPLPQIYLKDIIFIWVIIYIILPISGGARRRRRRRPPTASRLKGPRKQKSACVLESSTRGAARTRQERTEKIIVLPGLAIRAPPRVYALRLGTGATASPPYLRHCTYAPSHIP
ncbi:hypothetical protein EVAR_14141_1 [Eumeta japonica]|uniref:Uncharacterized protein n=1 Tax=Eumeta variegata TaxID=151549 RepID=A0A4C1UEK5_EUMVA|nr:hypothetical protein EVAR_14141_1 [Eumeta japonica]